MERCSVTNKVGLDDFSIGAADFRPDFIQPGEGTGIHAWGEFNPGGGGWIIHPKHQQKKITGKSENVERKFPTTILQADTLPKHPLQTPCYNQPERPQ